MAISEKPSVSSFWQQRKTILLSILEQNDITALKEQSHRLEKKRGQTLWLKDQQQSLLYIVDQGYVRHCRDSAEGKRMILAIYGPGEFFGTISPEIQTALEDEYIEVVQDTRLICIASHIFQEVLSRHPSLLFRLVDILENRYQLLEQRMFNTFTKDVAARTACLLLELVNKYGENCSHEIGMNHDLNLTHQEVADLVGATRPVISGVLSQFMKAQMIAKHDGKLCIYNRIALAKVAECGQKSLTALL